MLASRLRRPRPVEAPRRPPAVRQPARRVGRSRRACHEAHASSAITALAGLCYVSRRVSQRRCTFRSEKRRASFRRARQAAPARHRRVGRPREDAELRRRQGGLREGSAQIRGFIFVLFSLTGQCQYRFGESTFGDLFSFPAVQQNFEPRL